MTDANDDVLLRHLVVALALLVGSGLWIVLAEAHNRQTRDQVETLRARVTRLSDRGEDALDGALDRLHESMGETEALRGELATAHAAVESLSRQLMAERRRR